MTTANPGPRRAALLLHAMQERDRNWVLAQLPDAERVQLCAMLDELHELGIPAEIGLLDDVLKANGDAAAGRTDGTATFVPISTETHAGLQTAIYRIRLLPAPAVAQALRHEPAALTAMLLKMADWPWQDEVLSRLGVVKRRQVEEYLATAPVEAPKLAESLLGLLLPKIIEISSKQLPAERPLPPPKSPSWRRHVVRHMQSLFGMLGKASRSTSPSPLGRRDS